MRKFTLDVAKWRCGGFSETPAECWREGDGVHGLGKGNTNLLNDEGYSCCLGQFAMQVLPEHLHNFLEDMEQPLQAAQAMCSIYDSLFVETAYRNTNLAEVLMKINDNSESTIKEKIAAIKAELAKHHVELEVINGEQYA